MNDNENLKILIVGDSSVGKTCIFRRFSENYFEENFIATIGLDYSNKEIEIEYEGSRCKVNITIWDTAGQERFRAITKNYYKGAHGILLVYDATERKTFENLNIWIASIRENTNSNIIVMLIANKIDAPNKVVKTAEGETLAKQIGCEFWETSAKTNTKITEVFQTIAVKVYAEFLKSKEAENQFKIQEEKKKKKECCH